MTGTYSAFKTDISQDELNVFKKAIGQLVGVNYQPLAVSSQVVSGINYKFFCNATPVYPNAITEPVIILIYEQLDGSVHLNEIKKI
ncbi:MAG: hypothetical protein N2645_22610 [Clostridia bacterium]|nr:hypothetical protein [Clostridia bacterium]